MDLYFSVFRLKLQQQLQYRSEFLLNIIGDLLYIYIQISIWRALLPSGNSNNTTAEQMATFVVVAFILKQLTRAYFSMAMAEKVKSGSIAMDFIRPINLKSYMFSEQLSQNVLSFIVSSIPIIIIATIFLGLSPPITFLMGLFFFVSVVFAVLLMYTLDYTLSLTVFWLKNGVHPRMIMSGLIAIFSGSTIPLWFYPKWLANICMFLPFRMITFEPIQIYIGRYNTSQALETLGLQLIWIIIATVANNFVWEKAKKLVFVQGG